MTETSRKIKKTRPGAVLKTRSGKMRERVNLEFAAAVAVLLAAFCANTGYASSQAVNTLFAVMCAAFSFAFGLLVRCARVKGRQQAYFLAFLLLCSVMIVLMPAYYRSTETGGLLLGLNGWLIVLLIWQALTLRAAAVWLAFPLTAAAAFASPWLALAFIPLIALTVLMNAFSAAETYRKRSKTKVFSTLPVLAALLIVYAVVWAVILLNARGQGAAVFDFPNIPLRGLWIRFAELLPLFAVTAAVYLKAVVKAGSALHRVYLILSMLSPLLIAVCFIFTDCVSGMATGEVVGRFQQLPLVVPCVCAAAGFGFLLSSLAAGDEVVIAAAGEVSRYFKEKPAAFVVLAVYIIKTTLTGGLSEWISKTLAG